MKEERVGEAAALPPGWLELESADPEGGGDEERAHADERNDVMEHISHYSLLFLMCFHFVLFLFNVSRNGMHAPDTRRHEG
jgi:hypothetical protein